MFLCVSFVSFMSFRLDPHAHEDRCEHREDVRLHERDEQLQHVHRDRQRHRHQSDGRVLEDEDQSDERKDIAREGPSVRVSTGTK